MFSAIIEPILHKIYKPKRVKMKIKTLTTVYFSATYTTQKLSRWIAQSIKPSFKEYDITRRELKEDIFFDTNDLVIIGVPVYAGRVPAKAAKSIQRLKGNDTPTILIAVYGNRAYEDALVELKDITESNFFKVVSIGAFIGRHSIFTPLAKERPDSDDQTVASNFAIESAALLNTTKDISSIPSIQISGNRPYKPHGQYPIFPSVNDSCNRCGKCSSLCPSGAIPLNKPNTTDTSICFSCGRCLVICPKQARNFEGDFYNEKLDFFLKSYSERKESELFYAK